MPDAISAFFGRFTPVDLQRLPRPGDPRRRNGPTARGSHLALVHGRAPAPPRRGRAGASADYAF